MFEASDGKNHGAHGCFGVYVSAAEVQHSQPDIAFA